MFKYSYCNVYMHFHLPTTCLLRFCVSYGYLQAWACFFVFFVKVTTSKISIDYEDRERTYWKELNSALRSVIQGKFPSGKKKD